MVGENLFGRPFISQGSTVLEHTATSNIVEKLGILINNWMDEEGEDEHPTSSQALQWVLPEQQCDELLSISWRCVLSLRPVDLIWIAREAEAHTSMHCTSIIHTEQKSKKILTTDNLTKQLFRSVSEKRHTSHQELVENDPHGPPIHGLPVSLPQDYLWSDVLRGSTHLQEHRPP